MIESARGVQHSCNLGLLRYSPEALKILNMFKYQPPVPGARVVSFIENFPSTEWHQEGLGVSLNRRESLVNGFLAEHHTEEQRIVFYSIGLTVIGQWMRDLGILVETEESKRDLLNETDREEPVELVRRDSCVIQELLGRCIKWPELVFGVRWVGSLLQAFSSWCL